MPSQTEQVGASTQKRPGAMFAFVLLFLLYFFDYADRVVVSSLLPDLKREWGLSDAQGAMFFTVVYWSIIAATLPVSILADRWSRKNVIAGMAIFWSIATAACGFARNYSQMILCRVAIGVGEAGYAPAGTAMISGLFEKKRRSLMMGIWNASIPLGSLAGLVTGAYIAKHYGWKHAFGVVALPGLIVACLFFFVKDYKTVELKSAPEGPPMARGDITRRFLSTPSLLFTFFGFAANTFVTGALLFWLQHYFNREYGVPLEKASLKAGSVMALAIVGAPLGGFLADRWLRSRENARPLFAGISALLTAVAFFAAFSFLRGVPQDIMLYAGGVLALSYVPAAAAVTQDVVHPGLRAISYSLCVVVQNLLGSSLGPLFVGAVSDQVNLATALSILPAFSLLSGLLFLLAARRYNEDHRRAAAEEAALAGAN